MPVHINSVIDTQINTFDPALYTAITDKEYHEYTSGTNGKETEYSPLFTELSNALVSYFNIDREESMRTFMQSLYGYVSLSEMFNTDSSLLSTSDSATVQSLQGFRSRIKADPVSYYDDYPQLTFSANTITRSTGSWITDGFAEGSVITVSGSTVNNTNYVISAGGVADTVLTLVGTTVAEGPSGFIIITADNGARMGSSLMKSDISLINTAYTNQEEPDMNSLVSGYLSVIGAHTFDVLFADKIPVKNLSKDDMNIYIFDTLGYRGPLTVMNIGSMSIPPPP